MQALRLGTVVSVLVWPLFPVHYVYERFLFWDALYEWNKITGILEMLLYFVS